MHGDKPIPQHLRPVAVMHCVPGNLDHEDGEPITILTLAHKGEVEQALAISIPDTERLVIRALHSLATHGDRDARKLLYRYVQRREQRPPRRRRTTKRTALPVVPVPPPPPLPRTADGQIKVAWNPFSRVGRLTRRGYSQVQFTLHYPYHVGQFGSDHHACHVIAAYRRDDDLYVLFRVRPAKDGLGKLVPPDGIVIEDDEDQSRLPNEGWESFLALKDETTFKLNGRTWTKVSPDAVAPSVQGKVFRGWPPTGK